MKPHIGSEVNLLSSYLYASCAKVYCFRLNFNISKLGYWGTMVFNGREKGGNGEIFKGYVELSPWGNGLDPALSNLIPQVSPRLTIPLLFAWVCKYNRVLAIAKENVRIMMNNGLQYPGTSVIPIKARIIHTVPASFEGNIISTCTQR